MLNDGMPTDILFGSFEFETELSFKDGIHTASAMGVTASSPYQDIALDTLNHKIDELVQRGELRPIS